MKKAFGGVLAAGIKMTFDSWDVSDHLYFITASICGWKNLFANNSYAEIVLDSLTWLRKENRAKQYAFVLMPTHLHTIMRPINRSIGELLQNFASFTAHAILHQLEEDNRRDLLEYFRVQKRDNRHRHSIWQDVQAKNIFSEKFLAQKMEYIHQNPVSKKWDLVKNRAEYKYSSACFYDNGEKPIIEIDDIREFLLE